MPTAASHSTSVAEGLVQNKLQYLNVGYADNATVNATEARFVASAMASCTSLRQVSLDVRHLRIEAFRSLVSGAILCRTVSCLTIVNGLSLLYAKSLTASLPSLAENNDNDNHHHHSTCSPAAVSTTPCLRSITISSPRFLDANVVAELHRALLKCQSIINLDIAHTFPTASMAAWKAKIRSALAKNRLGQRSCRAPHRKLRLPQPLPLPSSTDPPEEEAHAHPSATSHLPSPVPYNAQRPEPASISPVGPWDQQQQQLGGVGDGVDDEDDDGEAARATREVEMLLPRHSNSSSPPSSPRMPLGLSPGTDIRRLRYNPPRLLTPSLSPEPRPPLPNSAPLLNNPTHGVHQQHSKRDMITAGGMVPPALVLHNYLQPTGGEKKRGSSSSSSSTASRAGGLLALPPSRQVHISEHSKNGPEGENFSELLLPKNPPGRYPPRAEHCIVGGNNEKAPFSGGYCSTSNGAPPGGSSRRPLLAGRTNNSSANTGSRLRSTPPGLPPRNGKENNPAALFPTPPPVPPKGSTALGTDTGKPMKYRRKIEGLLSSIESKVATIRRLLPAAVPPCPAAVPTCPVADGDYSYRHRHGEG